MNSSLAITTCPIFTARSSLHVGRSRKLLACSCVSASKWSGDRMTYSGCRRTTSSMLTCGQFWLATIMDSAPAQRSASAIKVFCPIEISGSSHTTNSTCTMGRSCNAACSASRRSCDPAISFAPCWLAPSKSAIVAVELNIPVIVCGSLVYTGTPSFSSASAVSARLMDVVASTRSGCSATIASRLGSCGEPTCGFSFAAGGMSQYVVSPASLPSRPSA